MIIEAGLINETKKEKESRYWIDTGVEVCHRDYPLRKMMVDRVIKKSIERESGERKVYTVGVDCHWMDAEGKYGQGRFLTMELKPYAKY